MNKVVKSLMTVAVFAAVCISNGYAQDTPTTGKTIAPVSPLLPVQYYNAIAGYQIQGYAVLAMPGGSRFYNTALGNNALVSITEGQSNTASGAGALQDNTSGGGNTATGVDALSNETTANDNTAIGGAALYKDTVGTSNTASGYRALFYNTGGSFNTASGFEALYKNATGSNNIALGYLAGFNASGAIGNNIYIGNEGSSIDSGVIMVGTTGNQTSAYIAGIAGVTLPVADEPLVCIDPTTGQLGTVNCASNGVPSGQLEMMGQRIESLQKQNAELQRRLSRLESLIGKR